MSQWLDGVRGAALIVAHPDDETWGLGSRLERLSRARFVYVTDGAPRNGADAFRAGFVSVAAYRNARREELAAVLTDAGIGWEQVTELGIPDQEALREIPWLVEELVELLSREPIELVLTHAYEGGHPDHDAIALAVHLAATRVCCPPMIVEMGGYRRGHAGRPLSTFLPVRGAGDEEIVALGGDGRARRERRLGLYRSQRETFRWLGALGSERLRRAPRYDFSRPPHDGPLLYEELGWGARAADLCLAARELRS